MRISPIMILIIVVLLASCGKSIQEIKLEKEATFKGENIQIETANIKAIVDLSQKYNSITGWDTLYPYTYFFQEMFIDQKKLMSFNGELKDITKIDSIYYLKVYNTKWNIYQNYIA